MSGRREQRVVDRTVLLLGEGDCPVDLFGGDAFSCNANHHIERGVILGRVRFSSSLCRAVLEKIRAGSVLVVTNTEILQEILYRYFSIERQALGELAYASLVEVCAEVLPVTRQDTDTDPHFDLIPEIRRIAPE